MKRKLFQNISEVENSEMGAIINYYSKISDLHIR